MLSYQHHSKYRPWLAPHHKLLSVLSKTRTENECLETFIIFWHHYDFLLYFINVVKVKNTNNNNKNWTFTSSSLRSTDLEFWLFWICFWCRVICTHVPLLPRLFHSQLLGFNPRQGQALFKLGSPLYLTRRTQAMRAVSLHIQTSESSRVKKKSAQSS